VGLTSAAGLVVAAAVGLAAPSAAQAGPALLVLAALLGLPHGAVDHLALGWSQGTSGPAPRALLVAYALGAVLVAAVALAAPVPAVLVLLLLSAAHFAEGEVAFDELRGGPGLRLPAAALGTAVVALPLLLRPDQVRGIVAALDPALPGVLAQVRLPVLVLTGVLVVAGLVVGVRAAPGCPTRSSGSSSGRPRRAACSSSPPGSAPGTRPATSCGCSTCSPTAGGGAGAAADARAPSRRRGRPGGARCARRRPGRGCRPPSWSSCSRSPCRTRRSCAPASRPALTPEQRACQTGRRTT
jgi:hypothetical protein